VVNIFDMAAPDGDRGHNGLDLLDHTVADLLDRNSQMFAKGLKKAYIRSKFGQHGEETRGKKIGELLKLARNFNDGFLCRDLALGAALYIQKS